MIKPAKYRGMTHEEIGRREGLSRTRILAIEQQALRKMRDLAVTNGWELGDLRELLGGNDESRERRQHVIQSQD